MKLYDARNVIIGLFVFLGLITFPIYYGQMTGKAAYRPEPQIPIEEKCIEPASYMRVKHMDLLAKWKELAIRQGIRTYVAGDGKEYTISLVETCVGCHKSTVKFCDQCHNYVGVKLNCWNCHITPPEIAGLTLRGLARQDHLSILKQYLGDTPPR